MPELLDFIRKKIPKRQLRPTREQIRQMIMVDTNALKRDAVMQHLLGKVDDYLNKLSDSDISIDADIMADEIDRSLNNGRHGEKWQRVLQSVIKQQQYKVIDRLNSHLL